MNREIIFRGKRIDNGEWVQGNLLVDALGVCFIVSGISDNSDTGITSLRYNEVLPETVGQFTGLYDKNGKGIYEDDIVLQQQYGGGKGRMVVCFEKGAFIVGYHQWNMVKTKPMLLNVRCEVIGNIHDNPELLK